MIRLQQIRGATVIVDYGGIKFLIDPWLADKGTVPPIPSPYNNNPNPLVDLPLPVSEIIKVDAVIVTHMHHFDHFDQAAQDALPKDMPMFTQNDREAEDMRGLGFQNVTALRNQGVSFAGVTLYRTDGEHGRGEAAQRFYEAMRIPADVCGVVFSKPGEKTLYIAGDTVWSDFVQEAIRTRQPRIIVLNAAEAAFPDGTPILIDAEGVGKVARLAPEAVIVAGHMDAVNHARLDRKTLRQYVQEQGLASRVLIPEDGEICVFD